MDILLSIIGSAVLAVLLSAAYTAGLCAGKAAANRRLDWSIRRNPDWYDQPEKGEVVSFYEWAVKMAEKEVENNEH